MSEVFTEIQQALGHTFSLENLHLLDEARTHSSWAHECGGVHNERLEFLGDAILKAWVTHLVLERFPTWREGKLSRMVHVLVSNDTLAEVARELDLGKTLRLGRGEIQSGGRDRNSILANSAEAFLGALFLDAGYEGSGKAVKAWIGPRMESIAQNLAESPNATLKNARSRLQEWAQQKLKLTPSYESVSMDGPSHEPMFVERVQVGDVLIGMGSARSRQEARRLAAADALHQLRAEEAF